MLLVAAGFMIGTFQVVGRSHLTRFLGGDGTDWYFELRLWVLVALSVWLMGISVTQCCGAERGFAGKVRTWSGTIVVFVGYMFVTILWAPDLSSAAAKAYDLMYVAWSCMLLVAALRICGIDETIRGFWCAILLFGLMLAVAGVLSALSPNSPAGRLGALGSGPNVFGRNMGLLVLASLRLVLQPNTGRWVRSAGLAIAPVATLLVLLSGSRGALLAVVVGVIVYVLVRRFDRRVRFALLLAGFAGLAAAFSQLGRRAVSIFADRFIRLLLVEGYTSNRDVLLVEGITAGAENAVRGLGLAGFAQVSTLGYYPHNIFVEAFAEGGVFGLILLCVPFVVFTWRWVRGQGHGDSATVAGLFLLGVSSSISGDLFDARGVFLLLLISIASQWAGSSVLLHRRPKPRSEGAVSVLRKPSRA